MLGTAHTYLQVTSPAWDPYHLKKKHQGLLDISTILDSRTHKHQHQSAPIQGHCSVLQLLVFFFFDFMSILPNVCECVCVLCAPCVSLMPRESGRGNSIPIPRTGVTDDCEPRYISTDPGTAPGYSGRAASTSLTC